MLFFGRFQLEVTRPWKSGDAIWDDVIGVCSTWLALVGLGLWRSATSASTAKLSVKLTLFPRFLLPMRLCHSRCSRRGSTCVPHGAPGVSRPGTDLTWHGSISAKIWRKKLKAQKKWGAVQGSNLGPLQCYSCTLFPNEESYRFWLWLAIRKSRSNRETNLDQRRLKAGLLEVNPTFDDEFWER